MAVGGQKRPNGKRRMPEAKSATRQGCRAINSPQGVTQGKSLIYGNQYKHGGHHVRQQPHTSTNELNNALAELSSGSKIVNLPMTRPVWPSPSRLNAQIGQTNAANSNVSNAVSFSQTQDGYLQQVGPRWIR
jgi:hypothetical protein